MIDTDRLDALAAAATPGPWHDEGGYIKAGAAAMTTIADMRYKTGERNRPFIAACDPATIRSLVAAVRERDALRAALTKAHRTLEAFNPSGSTYYGMPDSGTYGRGLLLPGAYSLDHEPGYNVDGCTYCAALHSKDGAS